jgi:hypothetical protein
MHSQPYPTRSHPEPALHLLGGIWIASCPTCGFQLTTARELGDVLQVFYALASQAGYSPAEIECARARKAHTRGAFTHRVVWHDPPTREDTS